MGIYHLLIPRIDVILITIRTAEQGALIDKSIKERSDQIAVCMLSEEDYKALGLKKGDRVEVKTEYGSTIVRAITSHEMSKGIAAIPVGPWASRVVGISKGRVVPHFKNIKATVERTESKVTTVV
ncbi:MAG: molybdopterin dinucleotide binding domain-containing protein [Candidatus Hodarchaeota archaeon]